MYTLVEVHTNTYQELCSVFDSGLVSAESIFIFLFCSFLSNILTFD